MKYDRFSLTGFAAETARLKQHVSDENYSQLT